MDVQEVSQGTAAHHLTRNKIYKSEKLMEIVSHYPGLIYAVNVFWEYINPDAVLRIRAWKLYFMVLVAASLGAIFICFVILARRCIFMPAIRYLFSRPISTRRKFTKYFLKIFMSFINHGPNRLFYGALVSILSLVCVISSHWEPDVSGFTKSAAEDFIYILLSEIFWKSHTTAANLISIVVSIAICVWALLVEIRETPVRGRDLMQSGARIGTRFMRAAVGDDEPTAAA